MILRVENEKLFEQNRSTQTQLLGMIQKIPLVLRTPFEKLNKSFVKTNRISVNIFHLTVDVDGFRCFVFYNWNGHLSRIEWFFLLENFEFSLNVDSVMSFVMDSTNKKEFNLSPLRLPLHSHFILNFWKYLLQETESSQEQHFLLMMLNLMKLKQV